MSTGLEQNPSALGWILLLAHLGDDLELIAKLGANFVQEGGKRLCMAKAFSLTPSLQAPKESASHFLVLSA